MPTRAADLIREMTPVALQRFGSERQWAAACALPAETLSRLKKRDSCDLRTLDALASAAGFTIVAARLPRSATKFGRKEEDALLDFCASGNNDAAAWGAHGDPFLMAGLAMMLASTRGFDRKRYLELAETLHPGMSFSEVFDLWLARTPVKASRFLSLLRHRRHAA